MKTLEYTFKPGDTLYYYSSYDGKVYKDVIKRTQVIYDVNGICDILYDFGYGFRDPEICGTLAEVKGKLMSKVDCMIVEAETR